MENASLMPDAFYVMCARHLTKFHNNHGFSMGFL